MKIGDIIYAEPLRNSDVARINKSIREFTIIKVGRKWFTVSEGTWETHRFDIKTLEHDGGQYTSQYQGYISMLAVKEKQEYEKLSRHIKENLWCLDLNHLRGISKAMEASKTT